MLVFNGFDRIGGLGAVTGCPGIGPAGLAGGVFTLIAMEWKDNTWRGRPAAPDGGSFELIVEEGPKVYDGPGPGPGVAGTVGGIAIDTHHPVRPPGALQVTLTNARLAGSMTSDGSIATGWVTGGVVFGNHQGVTFPCNDGTTWQLSRTSRQQ